MTIYRRTEAETWEDLAAAAAGVLAGAAVFYIARLWFQREALPDPSTAEREGRPEPGRDPDGGGRRGADSR